MRPFPSHLARAVLNHYAKPRVLGLDLLRIVASATVIIYHGNTAKAFGQNWLGLLLGRDGFLGVDIFFVLSGWLLTRQALRLRGGIRSPVRFATIFWTRRWARTIPAYWFVLLGLVLIGHRMHPDAMSPLRVGIHALFLQGILPPNFFGVSWSLIAEEWFYLLLPGIVILASSLQGGRLAIGLAAGCLLLPMAIRMVLFDHAAAFSYGPALPFARMDGLVVGSLLAVTSLGAPWWQAALRQRRWLFGAGCLGLIPVLVAGTGSSVWFSVVGLLAFNLLIGCLMPYLSELRWSPAAPMAIVMGVAYLSDLTYPLYLLHTVIPHVHWVQIEGPPRLALAGLAAAWLLGAATILHLGVERPFLALRDRYLSSNRVRVAGRIGIVGLPRTQWPFGALSVKPKRFEFRQPLA